MSHDQITILIQCIYDHLGLNIMGSTRTFLKQLKRSTLLSEHNRKLEQNPFRMLILGLFFQSGSLISVAILGNTGLKSN